MPATAFSSRPIGEIAATLPGATAVFRRHKLDFCCGGDTPLAEMAARRNVPLAEIEASLVQLAPGVVDLPEDTGALIDHIVTRFHDTHRRELPELAALANRVERVHADSRDAPAGLAALLMEMDASLRDHMGKEEEILFPMMRRGRHPMIAMPIGMMRAEHGEHAVHLAALDVATHGHAVPDGACNSWRALYAGTRKLAEDLVMHIHIENNILFPRFDA